MRTFPKTKTKNKLVSKKKKRTGSKVKMETSSKKMMITKGAGMPMSTTPTRTGNEVVRRKIFEK